MCRWPDNSESGVVCASMATDKHGLQACVSADEPIDLRLSGGTSCSVGRGPQLDASAPVSRFAQALALLEGNTEFVGNCFAEKGVAELSQMHFDGSR